jgi:hypothetical protein
MSATGAVTKIGDIMSITEGELPTGTRQQAGATGSPLQGLESPGAPPGDIQVAAFRGRTCNREGLNGAVLSVRGRSSDRATVDKAEGTKWPPVANGAARVAAPLADQAVGIMNGGLVIVGRPAGVQASAAGVADIAEVAGAGEAEVVEGNEEIAREFSKGS